MNTIVKKINIGCLVASVLTTVSAVYGTTNNSKLVALQLAAEKLTAENIAKARKVNGQRPFSRWEMQADVSEIMQLASVMQVAQEKVAKKKRELESELNRRWKKCFPNDTPDEIMNLKESFPGCTPEEVQTMGREILIEIISSANKS